MDNGKFVEFCKNRVVDYVNNHLDKSDNKKIDLNDVYVVWLCKTLQNNKALLSTTLFDGMYYEVTVDDNKKEAYIDAYKQWENYCVKVEE